MNRDDIIRMAREAGAEFAELPMMDAIVFSVDDREWNSILLERFAKLVYEKAWADTALALRRLISYCNTLENEAYAKVKGQAIEALKAALEQPEPWVKSYCGGKPNYTTPEQE